MKYVKEELQLKTEPRKTLQLSADDCSAIADRFAAPEQAKEEKPTANCKPESLQLFADEVSSLQLANAVLKARIDAMERENRLLKERLDKADEALEREQMQARGFWGALGQKLLGNGKK